MGFIREGRDIVTRPDNFFKSVKKDSGYIKPWLYYAKIMAVYLLLGLPLQIYFLAESVKSKQLEAPFAISLLAFIFITCLAYCVLIGLVFALAGINHLFLLIAGARGGFLQTFKLSCYSATPLVAVPLLAPAQYVPTTGIFVYLLAMAFIMVYLCVIEVKAAQILHGISAFMAVVGVVVIPLIVAFVIGLILVSVMGYFIIPRIIAAIGA